jgi:suppressor of G2 allele of SKP1
VTVVERPKVDLNDGKKKKDETKVEEPVKGVEAPKQPVQTPPSQIKHDWYQNKDNIYFTLLAKGVPQDKAHIEIEESSVCSILLQVSRSKVGLMQL